MTAASLCLACGAECPQTRPYCITCTFLVRAEIEHGMRQFAEYLQHWAEFAAWEQVH